jgi:putative tryptophan/tyrosine transport system substrate-binding protein
MMAQTDVPGKIGRREFTRLAMAMPFVWPVAARAQDRVRIVALLVGLPLNDVLTEANSSAAPSRSRIPAFRRELANLGWIEDRNWRMEIRSTFGGEAARTAAINELIALNPAVILTAGMVDTIALLAATRTIPVVFGSAADPVGSGFVSSLARPGGNVTGYTSGDAAIGGKWLQFITEANPRVSRVGVLFNPALAPRGGRYFLEPIEEAAGAAGVRVSPLPVMDPSQFEAAIGAYAGPEGGLIVPPDSFAVVYRQAVVAAAARHRVTAIYPYGYFTDIGGLMSYSAVPEVTASTYVNLILRGVKAGDLPVQSPRKYELRINRKAADQLGLKLPVTLLARADEIIA